MLLNSLMKPLGSTKKLKSNIGVEEKTTCNQNNILRPENFKNLSKFKIKISFCIKIRYDRINSICHISLQPKKLIIKKIFN